MLGTECFNILVWGGERAIAMHPRLTSERDTCALEDEGTGATFLRWLNLSLIYLWLRRIFYTTSSAPKNGKYKTSPPIDPKHSFSERGCKQSGFKLVSK